MCFVYLPLRLSACTQSSQWVVATLQRTVDSIAKQSATLSLDLPPLTLDDLCALLGDTLRCDRREERLRQLGALVMDKTQGNPFWVTQLLRLLFEQGLLNFAPQRGAWEWDAEAVAKVNARPARCRVCVLECCAGGAVCCRVLPCAAVCCGGRGF